MSIEISSQIQAAEAVSTHSNNDMGFFSLFAQADMMVKFVVIILLFFSVCSWAIILTKIIILSRAESQSNKFEKYFWSGQMIDQLYERVRGRADHPMANIFVAAMFEWNRFKIASSSNNFAAMTSSTKDRIYQAMDIAKHKAMTSIEDKVPFLAVISSSSPFVGLFGTVWGIMNSFRSIASAKNATLAVVAPGIAEALFATALGLIVAIPALIFYNYFNVKINNYSNRLEDFSSEVGALLSRELDKSLHQ
jgi:biopolymer transport protein TolQ